MEMTKLQKRLFLSVPQANFAATLYKILPLDHCTCLALSGQQTTIKNHSITRKKKCGWDCDIKYAWKLVIFYKRFIIYLFFEVPVNNVTMLYDRVWAALRLYFDFQQD